MCRHYDYINVNTNMVVIYVKGGLHYDHINFNINIRIQLASPLFSMQELQEILYRLNGVCPDECGQDESNA